jgi:hypothetical protein
MLKATINSFYSMIGSKNVEFVFDLDGKKFWGILGILEKKRFIPHSPGNENSLLPVFPFPKE